MSLDSSEQCRGSEYSNPTVGFTIFNDELASTDTIRLIEGNETTKSNSILSLADTKTQGSLNTVITAFMVRQSYKGTILE